MTISTTYDSENQRHALYLNDNTSPSASIQCVQGAFLLKAYHLDDKKYLIGEYRTFVDAMVDYKRFLKLNLWIKRPDSLRQHREEKT